jgi:hypothetical protein
MLVNPEQTKTIPSRFTVDDFIKDPILKQFYMYDMNNVLENYEPGKPEHKPILLEQIKKMEDEREKRIKMLQTQQQISSLYNPINKDIENLRAEYEKKLLDKNLLINELLKRVKELTNQIYNFNTDKNLL